MTDNKDSRRIAAATKCAHRLLDALKQFEKVDFKAFLNTGKCLPEKKIHLRTDNACGGTCVCENDEASEFVIHVYDDGKELDVSLYKDMNNGTPDFDEFSTTVDCNFWIGAKRKQVDPMIGLAIFEFLYRKGYRALPGRVGEKPEHNKSQQLWVTIRGSLITRWDELEDQAVRRYIDYFHKSADKFVIE